MRKLLMLLFLSAGISLSAQEIIFSKTINSNEVPPIALLKTGIKSNYSQTRYVQQDIFLQRREFPLQLSPGFVLNARIVHTRSYPAGSVSYTGIVEGSLKGEISFSTYKDRTSGMIVLEDGRKYMIDQTASGIFAVSLSAENAYTDMESRPDFIELPEETTNGLTSICDAGSLCAAPSVIDIMVVYTSQAASAWGGVNNTVANITQAVSNMNTSMSNTGINNVSFRLVHTEQVSYTESGNFSTDLSRLAGTSDGYMDNVHSLRNQYGADLVCLIIGSPTSSCGIGYLNTSPTAYSSGSGFNVTLYSCAVGNYTMAHECGHNMGLRHDWYVDGSSTPCSHHHGYVNQAAISQGSSSPSSARWRTIMAYNNQCSDAGFNCTRLNRWSNPQLSYNGDPTGRAIGTTQPSDEAYAFYRMACLVAAFRPEVSSCPAPAGLSSSSVSTGTATLGWNAVNGALNYDVDYKPASSGSWTNAATATASLTVNLGGLTESTLYDWRVRANCTGGNSGYSSAQFTTLSSVCGSPAGLTTGNITSVGATASWMAVSGALHYDVQYKAASSGTWLNAATATTSLSVNLSGLNPSTVYDWQVRANCPGISSAFSQANPFTTLAVPVCPGPYDIATNDNTAGAATIPLQTDIKGLINPRNDVDFYRFTISTGGSITLNLTSLPTNYNLALLNGNGTQLAKSEKGGTTNEVINATVTAGTYYARVYPKGNALHASLCYNLRIQTGTAADLPEINGLHVSLFPNPAGAELQVLVDGVTSGAIIRLFDIQGKQVMQQPALNRLNRLDLKDLPAGLYLLQVQDGTSIRSRKFIRQ